MKTVLEKKGDLMRSQKDLPNAMDYVQGIGFLAAGCCLIGAAFLLAMSILVFIWTLPSDGISGISACISALSRSFILVMQFAVTGGVIFLLTLLLNVSAGFLERMIFKKQIESNQKNNETISAPIPT